MLFLYRSSKKFILNFLLFLSVISVNAQNLDSLLTVARGHQDDSTKIRMINKVAFSYIFNNTDKALEVINEGEELAKASGFNFGITELTNTKGIYMDVTGQSDSAQFYFTKGLNLSKQFQFRSIEVMCTNNLGMFNWNRGNFQEALNYFFEALRMNDESGDEKTRSIYLNNIGLIYQEMLLIEKALDYHQQAYDLRVKYNDEKNQAASLNNIGICLKELNRLQQAEATFKKGLRVAKASDNLRDYYKMLDNLGNVYQLQNKTNEAIQSYLNALDVPEELGRNEKSALATYSNLIRAYNKINKPDEALKIAEKGEAILKKYPQYNNDNEDFYLNSAESYYMLKNFRKARSYTEKFVNIKDSVFSEQNAKAVADLEIKYETEKKEKQILTQRADLAEKELKITKKNTLIYGLSLLALVLGFLGYLFYNQQKLKNAQLKKENELKNALLQIETHNKLQEQRLRISRDLHDNIGAQLTFIISSIDNLKYGFNINDDELTSKLDSIGSFTSDTIYELRDTIWAMNKSEITFDDLHSRISNYIEKADLSSSKTNFNFELGESVDENINFSSINGMNIYRIIQEAVNNAIKYAEAKQISVNLKQAKDRLSISVSDDGKGFDPNNVDLGNGLNNMKKRALDLDALFQLTSAPGKGTVISLTNINIK
ncbi:MAG: tetratricopeptide repeat protein [Flavobacteriaceae bacterium]|nr:tetratricopeptide repeat protein [Flavobacteriaceae bacterium]